MLESLLFLNTPFAKRPVLLGLWNWNYCHTFCGSALLKNRFQMARQFKEGKTASWWITHKEDSFKDVGCRFSRTRYGLNRKATWKIFLAQKRKPDFKNVTVLQQDMEKSLKEHNIFENRFSTFYESRLQIGKTAVRNTGLFTSPTKPISKLTLFLANFRPCKQLVLAVLVVLAYHSNMCRCCRR